MNQDISRHLPQEELDKVSQQLGNVNLTIFPIQALTKFI